MSNVCGLDELPKNVREEILQAIADKTVANWAAGAAAPTTVDNYGLDGYDSRLIVNHNNISDCADNFGDRDTLRQAAIVKQEFINTYKQEVEEYYELKWKQSNLERKLINFKKIKALVDGENLELDLTELYLKEKKAQLEAKGVNKRLHMLKTTNPEFCEYCDMLTYASEKRLLPFEEWKKERQLYFDDKEQNANNNALSYVPYSLSPATPSIQGWPSNVGNYQFHGSLGISGSSGPEESFC